MSNLKIISLGLALSLVISGLATVQQENAEEYGFDSKMIRAGMESDRKLFELVNNKDYQKGRAEALKGVDQEIWELEPLINSPIPQSSRYVYLNRPLAYFEILAGCNDNASALKLAKVMLKFSSYNVETYTKRIDAANRANNSKLAQDLNNLKNQTK